MRTIFKYILIFVFFASALIKIADFDNTVFLFASILDQPYVAARLSLIILILFEVFIILALLKDFYTNTFVDLCILFVFSLFIIFNIAFMIKGIENCGCLGSSINLSPVLSLIKSVSILIMYIYVSRKELGQNG